VEPIASYGISVIWPYLTTNDIIALNRVFDMYLKRMLCIHKSSQNRLVHHFLGVNTFVEYLQVKLNLPFTGNFGKLTESTRMKGLLLTPDFLYACEYLPEKWKGPLQKDRHVFTRLLVHGFHFKFCENKKFHHSDKNCKCIFCKKYCGQYHSLFCEQTPFTNLHQLAGEQED